MVYVLVTQVFYAKMSFRGRLTQTQRTMYLIWAHIGTM